MTEVMTSLGKYIFYIKYCGFFGWHLIYFWHVVELVLHFIYVKRIMS